MNCDLCIRNGFKTAWNPGKGVYRYASVARGHKCDVDGSRGPCPGRDSRDAVGVAPLTVNSALTLAAQQHSDDMAAGGFLSHVGSNGSQFWERMRRNGYPLVAGAENVLYRWDASVEGAYQQWYESDGHRVNMLNADYTEIGVAYAVGADGRYYFTMMLGAQAGGVVQPTPAVSPPTATAVPPDDPPGNLKIEIKL